VRKVVPLFFLILAVVLVVGACSSSDDVTVSTEQHAIPSNYETYTQEGLFSISYPPDWTVDLEIMEELMEAAKSMVEASGPSMGIEDIGMLFFCGEETWEGYYPSVSILIDLRSEDYWTLDEVDEANSLYDKLYTPGYKELSLKKEMVDGRVASILDCEDNDPNWGKWRYIQLTTVEGDYVWLVTCACEYGDFAEWEDTFYNIVRSLKILN